MAKKQPGVLLYFELRSSLKRLTLEQKGLLFEAIMDYAEFGVFPEFDDNIELAITWDFIQPKIDADRERYEKRCDQAREAIESRWRGQKRADASLPANTNVYAGIRSDTKHTNSTTTTTSTSTQSQLQHQPQSHPHLVKGSLSGDSVEGSAPDGDDASRIFEALRREKMQMLSEASP